MIKLVVFDLAGTTIKDEQYVQKVLKETVSPYITNINQQALDQVMGWPKPKALKYVIENSSDKVVSKAFSEELNRQFVDGMIRFFNTTGNLQEIEGTTDVFIELKKHGIKIALDTGFSRPIADVIIDKLAWNDGLIDAMVASDEVAHGRPAPDMIFELMRQLKIKDIKTVAKVGDSEADILQGLNAGCRLVVGVCSGSSSRQALTDYNADFVINSVIELPKLI